MKIVFLIGLVLMANVARAQDSAATKLQVKGYIKDLQSLNFSDNLAHLTTGNMIHHRLNLKWRPTDRITSALEIRNRLFWGEEVALIPDFANRLRNQNEALDLIWNLLNEEKMLLTSTIDRLWVEYNGEKWNVRIGRQRINWGIGTTWNPNDLFNTFNFLDFDYEERPGSDGVKFQYNTGEMEYLETSVSFSERSKDIVAAARYFRNVASYDLQFLAGVYHRQPTVGFGWSGSIQETGFKGEVQYFFRRGHLGEQLNATAEADYLFSKGWYLNVGAFVNSAGTTKSGEMFADLAAMQFSPRNLMPTHWNSSVTVAKEISPVVSINTTIIYSPGTNLMLLLPSVNCSLTDNLDIGFFWQSFFANRDSSFNDLSHRCFLRMKWSY